MLVDDAPAGGGGGGDDDVAAFMIDGAERAMEVAHSAHRVARGARRELLRDVRKIADTKDSDVIPVGASPAQAAAWRRAFHGALEWCLDANKKNEPISIVFENKITGGKLLVGRYDPAAPSAWKTPQRCSSGTRNSRTLADEYDAAQERGEVATGGPKTLPDGNTSATTAEIAAFETKAL